MNFRVLKFFLKLTWIKKTAIAITNATTPPNLLGILRKIAYAKRKYHSGIIWIGVLRGLAGIKFSGSPKRNGVNKARVKKNTSTNNNVKKSLIAKYFKKGILSRFIDTPKGLLEPFSWRKKMWTIAMADKIKGIRKCNIKNRVKVPWPIENPPHNHCTMLLPTYGIAEAKFVITVAPQ